MPTVPTRRNRLAPHQIRDVSAVMEVEPEMIPLLGRLEYPDHMLNPWSRLLRGELAHLDLGPGARVLDSACGIGGVAVMVAREFEASVRGYDVLADHVGKAEAFAVAQGQGERCAFSVADVRDGVHRGCLSQLGGDPGDPSRVPRSASVAEAAGSPLRRGAQSG